MSDSQDSGGQNHDKHSKHDHSGRLYSWDTSFTSTLDMDAIKVSHSSSDLAPLSSLTETWDQGPPVLIPNVDLDKSIPRLEPMDQDQESSGSESESDDCSASESESGSSSSSCSSVESGSSSEGEAPHSQIEHSASKSSKSKHLSHPQHHQSPSQSCPSPPLLMKQHSARHHRNLSGSSSRSRKKRSSGNSGLLVFKHNQETLSGSDREENTYHKKRPSSFANKSHRSSELRFSSKKKSSSKDVNCDDLPSVEPLEYNSKKASTNSFKDDTPPFQHRDASRKLKSNHILTKDDITESHDNDSDCMILETVTTPRSKTTEDASYRHKQTLISGIYGKNNGKTSSSKSLLMAADKHVRNIATPQLSDSDDDDDDDDSDSHSSSSSCSDKDGDVSPPPAIVEASTSSNNDDSCDKLVNSSSDHHSDDSLPPPLLEPQIIEGQKNSRKKKSEPKVVVSSKIKKRSHLPSLSFISPSSSSCSSPAPPHHSLVQDHHSSSAPPLLPGRHDLKHNRGRPRKNPPTLQPQTSSYYDDTVPGEKADEAMSVDLSAEESSDNVEVKKKKKGKLSVLYNAAKHWKRTQDSNKSQNDKVYEFDEFSDKKSSSSDDDSNCDTKHSKVVLSEKTKKTKHKHLTAVPQPLNKYKHLDKKKTKTKKMLLQSSDDDSVKMFSRKKSEYSRPSSSVSNLTGDESGVERRVEMKKSRKNILPAESDASSCVEDNAGRKLKSDAKPVYQQFSTKQTNHFGKCGGLIFSKKFCTRKTDTFWINSVPKIASAEESRQDDVKQELLTGPGSIATKASLKEMPNNPRNQVQQMLSVLAAATKAPTKTTKIKKKVKEEKKEVSKHEPMYDTQSEDEEGGRSRKNKKGWKSKYKNIVDPVFLGELEHLIRDIASVQVDFKSSKNLDKPSDSVPSIFKRRKIFTGKRKRDVNKSSRPRGKSSKFSEQKTIEILDLTGESDEQRLPLKKRHHHHLQDNSTARVGDRNTELNTSFDDIEVEAINPAQALIQVKTPEKICREFKNSSNKRDSNIQPLDHRKPQSGLLQKLLQDKLIKKQPTAADRIVEKLGIQIKRENSNSGPGNDSRGNARRISKDLEILGSRASTSNNSSKDLKTTSSPDQNRLSNIEIKSETKLKHHHQAASSEEAEMEATFVDNIQDCIDKYTAPEQEKKLSKLKTFGGVHHSFDSENYEKQSSSNYAPIFSSPEPDISGRNSSLSQSSGSSDCCIIEESSSSSTKNSSRVGRSSRQDLHSHLWRQEKTRSESEYQQQSVMDNSVSTCRAQEQQQQQHHHSHMSKPLPTEPIRRVDLGGRPHSSFCTKPGFLGSQECLIRKVPQAIVAPFRRNPPEQSSSSTSSSSAAAALAPVVPIHRASIAHSSETSSQSSSANTLQSSPADDQDQVSQEHQETKDSPQNQEQSSSLLDQSRIKKCQVAVERLKQVAPECSEGVISQVSDEQKHSGDSLDESSSSSEPEKSLILHQQQLREEAEEGEKSGSTTQNIVSSDKNTKENKCSLKKLENVISKPRVVENILSKHPNDTEHVDGETTEDNDRLSCSLLVKKSSVENNEISATKSKKRRRKTNKTGFPANKKKKKIVPLHHQVIEQSSSVVEDISLASESRNLSISVKCKKGGIFDNLETFKISAANIDLDPGKQTSSGRPLRECRVQDDKNDENQDEDTKRVKSRKRQHSPSEQRKGKRVKRSRPSSSHSPFKRTTSSSKSSIDPSPASSDVESVDYRSFLDDADVDGSDYLTGLPCLEDNLLSPSLAESSELHSDERRKKVKQQGEVLVKKNFLRAGLFSYDYKTDAGKVSRGSGGESFLRNKGLMYKPEEHPFSLLPPPYYCGRQLRQKREDFALPYDLWSLHSTNNLPNRDILVTWNYKRIKSNIYYDVKPTTNYETPACHCKPPTEPGKPYCGNKCLNRMTFTECDPDSCPLSDKCSNMLIQKQKSQVVVQRFQAGEKGFGIRTKTHIPKGTFIMEYLGEVVTDKEFKRRMQTDYQKDSHHYCLHVGEGLVIDGYRMGGECRFVNHSCDPNCEMQKWSVNGMWRMALFSKGPIDVNEELTYDYNFSWFNTREGQVCHCGSEQCRGIIGGKGKKVTTASAKKTNKDSKSSKQDCSDDKLGKLQPTTRTSSSSVQDKSKTNVELLNRSNLNHFAALKPMTPAQQSFCRSHSVLLLRNLDKIRKLRDLYLNSTSFNNSACVRKITKKSPPITALESSDVATKAEEEPQEMVDEEVKKVLTPSVSSVQTKLAKEFAEVADSSHLQQISQTFLNILNTLSQLQDEDGNNVINHFMRLPPREECGDYYSKLSEPIDISSITTGLESGQYRSVAQIDQDLLLLFQNNTRYHGFNSRLGKLISQIRDKYLSLCSEYRDSLSPLDNVQCLLRPEAMVTDEDVINCGCCQYKDEGVMIQCDSCQCWQHTDCVDPHLDPEIVEHWTCDQCQHRDPTHIALVPQPEFASSGETYYVSMIRDDGMQLVLGMTVYVLRAFKDSVASQDDDEDTTDDSSVDKITVGHGGVPHKSISPIKGPSKEAASLLPANYPTYKTVEPSLVSTHDMDIFRVERLWTNSEGKKFAFGYHYLRPHETFHEPSRKFYDNEVFRVPLYEVLPLDTIWRQCWVMDPVTFCRGRPHDAQEEHVYICESRVDKTARLFNKISKHKYPTCTKFYVFKDFDLKLKLTRSYTPHQLPSAVSKAAGSRVSKDSSNKVSSSDRTQGTKDTVPGKKTKQKQKLSHKILQKQVRLVKSCWCC